MRIQSKALILALNFCVLFACATRDPGDPVRPGYNVYSPEQDVQLGKQAASEIRKQVDVVDDPELQGYISRLGQRIAEQPQAGGYPYEFTLINDPSINAFALPGGPIFVHTGLVRAAKNENQLVGVLAHEVAHVALRHGTSQASKAQIAQLPAILAGAAIGQDSALAQLGQIGLGLGVNSLLMKYSRSAEKEADVLGARMMAQAGYDPMEMARFFEKLETEGGARPPAFLSSHPDPGNRVELVRQEVALLPQREYNASTGQFPHMETAVGRLPEPQRPQEVAAAQPPSAPTGAFRKLEGRGFSLSYPRGWEAFGGRGSSVVTLAPRQGLVRTDSGVSIGYGAVLSYYSPQRSRAPLIGATQELVNELQSVNRNLRVSGGPRRVRIQGNRGLVTTLTSRSPYGGTERNVLLTVARPEGLFYMIFVAPEKGLKQRQPTFEQMLDSIRFR